MQTSIILSILCGLWAIASVLANPHGSKPAVCNADNCLNAIQAPTPTAQLSEASAYCSQYLSTSIKAVVKTVLVKTTKTLTLASKTITAKEGTATKTIAVVYTTTITTGIDKRADVFPTFAEHCTPSGTVEKPARVTSACSCLLVNTPPVSTKTSTNTVLRTVDIITAVTTFVPTTTKTVTVTTATVWVYVPPPPNCNNPLTCT